MTQFPNEEIQIQQVCPQCWWTEPVAVGTIGEPGAWRLFAFLLFEEEKGKHVDSLMSVFQTLVGFKCKRFMLRDNKYLLSLAGFFLTVCKKSLNYLQDSSFIKADEAFSLWFQWFLFLHFNGRLREMLHSSWISLFRSERSFLPQLRWRLMGLSLPHRGSRQFEVAHSRLFFTFHISSSCNETPLSVMSSKNCQLHIVPISILQHSLSLPSRALPLSFFFPAYPPVIDAWHRSQTEATQTRLLS